MCEHAGQGVLDLSNYVSNPHFRAAGGMVAPRPLFLILLVGNRHNHVRYLMIGE